MRTDDGLPRNLVDEIALVSRVCRLVLKVEIPYNAVLRQSSGRCYQERPPSPLAFGWCSTLRNNILNTIPKEASQLVLLPFTRKTFFWTFCSKGTVIKVISHMPKKHPQQSQNLRGTFSEHAKPKDPELSRWEKNSSTKDAGLPLR